MCGDHCALANNTELLADHVVCVVDASGDFAQRIVGMVLGICGVMMDLVAPLQGVLNVPLRVLLRFRNAASLVVELTLKAIPLEEVRLSCGHMLSPLSSADILLEEPHQFC